MHRKFTHYLLFCALCIVLLGIKKSSCKAQEENYDVYRLRTVVIDPGHGGKDPGALGKHTKEKEIVLQVAKKVGKYIEQYLPEVKVVYTRNDDSFIRLSERAAIANKAKADLFISIHANSNTNRKAYGAETYVMGLHKSQENLDVAKMENSAILYEEDYSQTYEGFEPNSSESYIIFSMLQNTHLEQSLDYASFIQQEFRTKALRRDRGVKQAGFVVLWRTTMPSVLVELGFISNPKEEAYLRSEQGQDYLASAIFRAFRAYKENVEEQSRLLVQQKRETLPVVEKHPDKDTLSEAPAQPKANVYFKVQIASATKPIPTDSAFFKGMQNIEEFKVNQRYKYAAGYAASYKEVVSLRKKIIAHFPDAFVVGVENGTLIPVREAIKKLQ